MYLSVRIPLVAFSKRKCDTFCRKVPPAKTYQHFTTQERAVVTTMRDVLCSIRAIAQRLCRSASTMGCEIAEGRSWTCRAFVFALPYQGPPRPWPMEGLRDHGRWQAFVGGHAGRMPDRFRGAGRRHQDRRRQLGAVLNGEPAVVRKMMNCDQGSKMHGHRIFTERTGLPIDSVDPHGPWQRGQPERQRSAAPVPLQKHRLIDFLPGRVECHCAVA